MVKSTGCSSRGSGLNSQHPYDGLQQSVILVSGNLTPATDIFGQYVQMVLTLYAQAKQPCAQQVLSLFFMFYWDALDCLFFQGGVSRCSLGCPGLCFVAQAALEFTMIRLPLPPWVLGSQACATAPGGLGFFFAVGSRPLADLQLLL